MDLAVGISYRIIWLFQQLRIKYETNNQSYRHLFWEFFIFHRYVFHKYSDGICDTFKYFLSCQRLNFVLYIYINDFQHINAISAWQLILTFSLAIAIIQMQKRF